MKEEIDFLLRNVRLLILIRDNNAGCLLLDLYNFSMDLKHPSPFSFFS